MTTLYQTAQAFVVKYDPQGNFNWAYTLTGTGSTLGQDIVLDPAGFVYVVGNMDYTIDFDPGPDTFNLTSTLITDAFIQKIDTTGHLVWARLIGSTGNDYAEQVKIDAQGDVFLVGSLGGVADFDPGPQVLNVSNGNYIFKMHASGAPVWVKSTAASVIANIDFDQFGHLYVAGISVLPVISIPDQILLKSPPMARLMLFF